MVQATAASSSKNLWVAASDGDLERVQYLIENEGATPNDKDSNSYTPMHAAASYAHLPLLTYLLSKSGNPNLPDSDGETPLFVIESVEVAQFLVAHGADPAWKNEEGQRASDVLEDDHPEIASYLRGLLPEDQRGGAEGAEGVEGAEEQGESGVEGLSQLAMENYTSEQTAALMAEAQRIMEQCAADGTEPDERLRELVERAVASGLQFGREAGEAEAAGAVDGEERKRVREE
ncbi:hypothetical protein IAT38_000181 [Cryptococcus sp. DSM 104549]